MATEQKILSSPKKLQYPTQSSGYECDFFERPPEAKWLQTECPICLLVLREPYLTSCCGHSFCRLCIERIKSDRGSCPLCNERGFGLMHNKGLERSLKEFDVKCTHNKGGCVWIGKLGLLDRHLNLSPESTKQLEGCAFAEIECIHRGCKNSFERRSLARHQEECPMRPYCCNYCLEYESTFKNVTANHWPVCKCYPLLCPNGCSEDSFERQYLEHHLFEDCPLAEVDCNFKDAGCDKRLLRKDMQSHLTEEQVTHLSLLVFVNQTLSTRLAEKDSEIAEMKEEMKQMKDEVESLRENLMKDKDPSHRGFGTLSRVQAPSYTMLEHHITTLQHHMHIVPLQFTLREFNEHKTNSEEWFSEPFYTHPRGYRMRLNVDANGYDEYKGTHVSVFIRLVRGDFDNTLHWPFQGTVTIQLLNQSEDYGHLEKSINVDGAHRITMGEWGTKSWGIWEFVAHSALRSKKCQYLKFDCLRFFVTKVEDDNW